MKISGHPSRRGGATPRTEQHATGAAPSVVTATPPHSRVAMYLLAALRISLGWVFLWAALDKTFGLGHETTRQQAWIHGGRPTYGFLHSSATGPFAGIYRDIAGQAWADWLFMLGLFGIGIALTCGVMMRISTIAAATMLVLMWSVVLPPANNPFMDDHLIYAIAVIALLALHAGRYAGLGTWWERQPLVRKHRALI